MNKEIVFGTDGIRGKADEYPFTQDCLYAIGNGIGKWVKQKYSRPCPRVLIACDTRESGNRIKNQLITGLQKHAIDIVDGFILPTPAVLQLINLDSTFDIGIVISASHNPYYDNGIKLFDAQQGKLSIEDEKQLLSHINVSHDDLQPLKPSGKHLFWKDAKQCYCDNFTTLFEPNFLAGFTIVVDCANGVASHVAKMIFEQFGARVISIADAPDGRNINDRCGALYPAFLQDFISQYKADIGFSFDGDGDRIVCVTADGAIKDGDDILFMLLSHPLYKDTAGVVGTHMTNSGLEDAVIAQGKKFVRSAIGDKYVYEELKNNNFIIGGETSGHVIALDYLMSGDAFFIALRLLESIIFNNNWSLKTFKKKPSILLGAKIEHRDDLTKDPYSKIIKSYEAALKQGRIFVRFSGTENILRVMVEDVDDTNTQNVAHGLLHELTEALNNNEEL